MTRNDATRAMVACWLAGCFGVLAVTSTAICGAQDGAAPAEAAPAEPTEVPANAAPSVVDLRLAPLARELKRLDTGDALECFRLAEAIADEFESAEALELARSLFVLAHEADRASTRPIHLAPSVYLALIPLARDEGERRWLVALSDVSARSPSPSSAGLALSPASLAVAEAIGFIRAGDSRGVRERLRSPAAMRVLAQNDPEYDAVRAVIDAAEDAALCPTCRNRRFVRTQVPGEDGDVETLCPVCRGNPGPSLSPVRLAQSLGAEARLLRAEPATWSGQFLLDGARPFQDPDASELAPRFGVDPRRKRWIPNPARPDDPFAGVWSAPQEPAPAATP
jgi:hypothetical protein